MQFFATTQQLLLKCLRSFIVIVLVLVVGQVVREQVSALDTNKLQVDRLNQTRSAITQYISSISDEITAQTRAAASTSLKAQQSLLDSVDREIKDLESRRPSTSQLPILLAKGGGTDYVKDTIRLEVLSQQRTYLQTLVQVTSAAAGRRNCVQRLITRGHELQEASKLARDNEERRSFLLSEYNSPNWNPLSDGYDEYQKLEAAYPELQRRYDNARNAYTGQEAACDLTTAPPIPQAFEITDAQRKSLLGQLDHAIRRLTEGQETGWLRKLLDLIDNVKFMALWLLAGVIAVPPLIKLLFYYVLAPAASRLPPIRIIADDNAPAILEPPASAISFPIAVGPDEELLVKPSFLQSSAQSARKHTKWFLNPSLPFASVLSGMYALTSIRPEGTAPTRVVVSAQTDPHGEIGIIEVPTGAAMVVQPRSLAGVVKPVGEPVNISRHWRLNSLHAWLTLQLRYLVFHGPCKLIMKGCRGVRSEEPDSDQPRLINQSATLGFSANLEYKTTRCETFVPYLFGEEDLFNDMFGGGPGRFVYEEVPAIDGKAGVAGRGLEGIFDAVLKIFGI